MNRNWDTKIDFIKYLTERFKNKEISEEDLRGGLSSTGLNEKEINEEVYLNK